MTENNLLDLINLNDNNIEFGDGRPYYDDNNNICCDDCNFNKSISYLKFSREIKERANKKNGIVK